VVVSNTLAGGRRRGYATSGGAMTANATQAILAMIGVSALLVRWPQGLVVLRMGGALFLAWIGSKRLRRAFSGSLTAIDRAFTEAPGPQPVTARPFREGYVVNMLNVAITSYYLGVIPNFLPPGGTWRGLAALYAAHIAIAFSCHVFWISLFHQARGLFVHERPRRLLDAGFGILLISLAIRIATR
jgi:threonine/homoserine/homoserine lactone efflux protein